MAIRLVGSKMYKVHELRRAMALESVQKQKIERLKKELEALGLKINVVA